MTSAKTAVSVCRAASGTPDFPARFGSIEDARAHCQVFFHWYNTDIAAAASGLGLVDDDVLIGVIQRDASRLWPLVFRLEWRPRAEETFLECGWVRARLRDVATVGSLSPSL